MCPKPIFIYGPTPYKLTALADICSNQFLPCHTPQVSLAKLAPLESFSFPGGEGKEINPLTSVFAVLAVQDLTWLHKEQALTFCVPIPVAEKLIADFGLTMSSASSVGASEKVSLRSMRTNPVQWAHSRQSRSLKLAKHGSTKVEYIHPTQRSWAECLVLMNRGIVL